jgi:hypothetical protein
LRSDRYAPRVAGFAFLFLIATVAQTALSHRTYNGASAITWVPVAIFEICTGVWLLLKGANVTATEPAERGKARV